MNESINHCIKRQEDETENRELNGIGPFPVPRPKKAEMTQHRNAQAIPSM